jgi:hypothetical protein
MNTLFHDLLDTLTQHIPAQFGWLPALGAAIVAAFGLLVLIKGAKLAPFMTAGVFLLGGAVFGSFLANWYGFPVWPAMLGVGLVGVIIGLALFKVWLAVLVAACFIGGSLSFYGAKVLQPHIEAYESRGLTDSGLVTLRDPGEVIAAPQVTAGEELSGLWAYLSSAVPNFQRSFFAILIAAGLAGAACGLLVSRLSRALLAATAGVGIGFVGAFFLLQQFWPAGLQWLQSLGGWGWAILGGVWAASFVFNLADCRPSRPKKPADDEEETPKGKTAVA